MTDKRIYQIGLTMINGVGDILARHLLQALGEAEAVFTEQQQLLGRIPGIGSNIAAEIKRPEILQRAEKELAFIEKNNISCYYLTDTDYPVRLRECPDRPLYFSILREILTLMRPVSSVLWVLATRPNDGRELYPEIPL